MPIHKRNTLFKFLGVLFVDTKTDLRLDFISLYFFVRFYFNIPIVFYEIIPDSSCRRVNFTKFIL